MSEVKSERRRQCVHCGKLFKYPSDCARHEKIHVDGKPYKCKYCDRSFKVQRYCNDHEKIVHRKDGTDGMLEKELRPYMCQYCGKQYICRSHCAEHELIHTGSKPYQCKYCDKSFITESKRKRHEGMHTGLKPYVCQFCGLSFRQRAHCIEHERLHTGEKPFQCAYCDKKFVTCSRLKIHERIHTGVKPFKCGFCYMWFRFRNQYVLHIKTVHSNDNSLKCTHCSKLMETPASLLMHERTQHLFKSFQCENCNESFDSLSALSNHAKLHSGQLFKCEHCNECFETLEARKVHQKTHVVENKYDECGKGFSSAEDLNTHVTDRSCMQSKTCEYCGKCIDRPSTSAEQLRSHSGEEPLKCECCDEHFAPERGRNRHQNFHVDGKRSHQCRYCDKTFPDPSNQIKHENLKRFQAPSNDEDDDNRPKIEHANVETIGENINTNPKCDDKPENNSSPDSLIFSSCKNATYDGMNDYIVKMASEFEGIENEE